MTIKSNISLAQGLLRNYDQNLIFSDEFLYTILIDSRSEILVAKLDKFERVSHSNFQKFCMGFTKENTNECGNCLPTNISCKAYRGLYQLPEVINGKIRDYLDVMTLDNKIIDHIPEEDADIIQYDAYKKSKPFYSIVNGFPILWNTEITAGVQFRGLWHNPADWIGKQLCTSTEDCNSLNTIQLYIPVSLRLKVFQRAMDLLRIPLALTEQDIQSVEKNLAV